MKNPSRVLIYRLGSLGDIVIALPCLNFVREHFPDAHITLLTNEPVSGKAAPAVAILGESGLCDEVIDYPVGTRDFGKLNSLSSEIRKGNYDMVINLSAARGLGSSLRDWCFFKASGVSYVIGTPFRKRDLEPKKLEDRLFESEAQRLANRLRCLGAPDLSMRRNWNLRFTREEEKTGKGLIEGLPNVFITASVGTKQPAKEWGLDNWTELFETLGKTLPGVGLVLLGVSSEFSLSDEVGKVWSGPVLNLCGLTSPRVTGTIMEMSKLFIGHDSGPMHLAAASGTSVVAIFAGTNPPGQWYPGHSSWKNMKVFYPELIDSWQESYRITRPKGLLLATPAEVALGVLEFC